MAWYGAFIRCADPSAAGTPTPEKYSVASHTDSATPASTSDVSICWPAPVRCRALERGQNADDGEETRAEIGQRNAGFHGWTAGFAGDRHDPGDALRDEIESALLRGTARSGRIPTSTRRSAAGCGRRQRRRSRGPATAITPGR